MTANHFSIEPLDPISIPLQGINLIEASAGTGKTYTITTLFIRLSFRKEFVVKKKWKELFSFIQKHSHIIENIHS